MYLLLINIIKKFKKLILYSIYVLASNSSLKLRCDGSLIAHHTSRTKVPGSNPATVYSLREEVMYNIYLYLSLSRSKKSVAGGRRKCRLQLRFCIEQKKRQAPVVSRGNNRLRLRLHGQERPTPSPVTFLDNLYFLFRLRHQIIRGQLRNAIKSMQYKAYIQLSSTVLYSTLLYPIVGTNSKSNEVFSISCRVKSISWNHKVVTD